MSNPSCGARSVSIVVFGLIAAAGARIWVDNRVDFADNRNLIVAAVTLVLGDDYRALVLVPRHDKEMQGKT